VSSVNEAAQSPSPTDSPLRIPTQKYLLQHRNHEGFLIKVETFTQPISPEEVFGKYGPGYYILKATKPRFKTIWKHKLGEVDQSEELQNLKKKTKHLTYGLVGIAATEITGFTLSHLRFRSAEERLDKVETILQTFKPEGFSCTICGKQLDHLLQKFCSQCSAPVDWPRRNFPIQSIELTAECPSCRLPLMKHQAYCPNCGRPRPILITYVRKREDAPLEQRYVQQ